jgi:TolB-like protein/tetratricopeptide (TPR) repeat protein
LERPFEAYRGDEPYVFICYAHDDKAVVYPEITWLHDQGANVWYDEGISPGEEWSEELGQAIDGAERFVYFVSPQSVASKHCRNELNFAQNHDKAILSVYLEETELPSGVELVIGASQAIVKPDLSDMDYRTRLLRAVGRVKDSPHPVRDERATGSEAGHQPPDGTLRRSLLSWPFAAVVLVFAGAGAAFWFLGNSALDVTPEERSEATNTLDRSLAVLSFSVVGTDAGASTYADAVTEELRTAVAGYQELRLISIADGIAPQEVDGASYVVGGNVQHLGDRMRLRAHLTRTDDRHTVWAQTFEHPAANEMPDSAETAVTVGRFVRLQVVQDQQCESVRRTSRSADAANAYCAANEEWDRLTQIGDGDLPLVLSRAQRAVALDPGIPQAYGLIAGANNKLGGFGAMDWRDASRNAHAALDQGLALAPDDVYLLMVRGYTHLELQLDYPAAEASFRASLASSPDSCWGHIGLGQVALARGNLTEALAHKRRALRICDAGAGVYVTYAGPLSFAGQHREAIRAADAGLHLVQSGGVRFYLLVIKAVAHDALNETTEANVALDEALESVGPMKPQLAGPLARVGRTDEARELLAELEALDEPPVESMVWAYAELDTDHAFDWIHKAIERHISSVIGLLRVSPVYSELRKDPRWDEVMRRLEAEEAKGRAGDRSSD